MDPKSLGICPSTLLADPFRIDGDILRGYLDASAAAGFDSLSLWGIHVTAAGDGAVQAVQSSGLAVRCVEASIGWVDGPSDALTAEIDSLIGIGAELGAELLGAACLGPVVDHAAAVAGLAAIAERAGEADMSIALEFLPWTGVARFADANEMCAQTGLANATVLLDTWHWVRQPGGPDLDLLRSLPGSRIAYVQICDSAAEPGADAETEAMTARLLPGDGTVDFASIADALDGIGSEPFTAAEVFNAELAELGPGAMAKAIAEASRRVLSLRR